MLGREDAAIFGTTYGVTPDGNFEGHTILNRLAGLSLKDGAFEDKLAEMRAKILAKRGERIRPGWDDKVLADWNGLMIASLARAAVVFEKPEWLTLAETAFAAILRDLAVGGDESGRLFHSYRAGIAKAPATASDYANMIWGALRLFEATGARRYLDAAVRWTATLDKHYWDEAQGGYFTAADDTTDVIVRLKAASDDAAPSANAIQLSNAIALAALTGEASYQERAERLVQAFAGAIAQQPVGHCGFLAAGLDLGRLIQVAVRSAEGEDLNSVLKRLSMPGALEFRGAVDVDTPSLEGKGALEGKSTAYICVGPTCTLPITDVKAFGDGLRHARAGDATLASLPR